VKSISSSELIINADGSIFHLHLRPEQLADRVILVGDPARVDTVANYLTDREFSITNREFHSVTGKYQGKRITVVSHGIGCDNIDIVLNELDALANIDFISRKVRSDFRQLTLVRIGTSGGLQPSMQIGTYVAAAQSIGLDGVLYFYDGNENVRDARLEEAIIRQLGWKIEGVRPYVVSADIELLNRITRDDVERGLTISANGFYAPQGRELRLPLKDPLLNAKIEAFNLDGQRITNYEMESSALSGLAALMGHKALTVCCIIAGRINKDMNTDYKDALPALIEKALDRI
jgi:uridine phosphorylase